MTQRYFRTGSEELYERVRLALDSQWGFPDSLTQTCFEPAATAPRDADGRVLLAVNADFCEYEAVAAVLPGLLASGAVEEIAEADYQPRPGEGYTLDAEAGTWVEGR